ncbi:MAG: signal recognition particle-docking protein FtsY [Nitrospinae bacterium]|nr:signal recognition particle-docking protein FtsY [Nitrospinota bacterium]
MIIQTVEEITPPKKGFFSRLREGLSKTSATIATGLHNTLLCTSQDLDVVLEELETSLIQADIGVNTVHSMLEDLRVDIQKGKAKIGPDVKNYLKNKIAEILSSGAGAMPMGSAAPFVIMVIGVNGSGKTTTIGKLAAQWSKEGKKVLLAAGDTFRAAAIEQLEIWSERSGTEFVKHSSGADPSAVIYDAIQAAQSRKCDVVLADTAGRLQNNPNLLEELKKVKRVMGKAFQGAPHEVLLVLDSTNGQNAISQAKRFTREIGVTGLVVTKLDGTAKGGTIVQIIQELNLPVRYIGIGEKTEDLREFNPVEYAEALFA